MVLRILKWNSSGYEKYEYGHLGSWYIKSILYERFLKWNKIKNKKKLVIGKVLFFVKSPFCIPHSIYLNIGFWQDSFVWNVAFSILVLSTKKRYPSFLKKVFVFQKTCFKIKVLEKFKISSDCHIKISQGKGYFDNP